MTDPLYEEQRRRKVLAPAVVREHMGMYIGGNDGRGFSNLFRQLAEELIDTAAVAPRSIALTFRANGWVALEDDGLPAYAREPFAPAVAQRCFTSGVFEDDYVSYGVFGSGRFLHHMVVNALAAELVVDLYNGQRHYRQTFYDGIPAGPPEDRGATERQGRTLQFRLAQDLFVPGAEVVGPGFIKQQRQLAGLSGGLALSLEDQRAGREWRFCYERGLASFLEELMEQHELDVGEIVQIVGAEGGVKVEVAFCWSYEAPLLRSFGNRWQTEWGGSHVEGLWQGLAHGMTAYARSEGLVHSIPIRSSELKGHVSCIVAVMLKKPLFEGCRKNRLASPEAKPAVARLVARELPGKLREQGLGRQHDLTYILRERFRRYSADGY